MIFWILCALLTLAAVVAVLMPYLRQGATAAEASDLEVYKDQLKEIDADEKRGLISADEAVTARVEVSRRILKADELLANQQGTSPSRYSKIALVCATLSVPLVSWGIYAGIGAAGMQDQPIAARLSVKPTDASLEVLVAKAEKHLKDNPNDGRGWAVLAPIYLRMSRFDDAIKAFEMAAKLNGTSAEYEIGIGKAWAGLNGGQANDEARAAYKRASELEPGNPEPRLLLAFDLAEQGKLAEAKAAFEAMLASAPENAPWRAILIDMIDKTGKALAAQSNAPASGPTQSDVEQAAELSDADRKAMIEGMVAQLDAKLSADASDVGGWIRLMQSYMVLKNPDKAREAYERAKTGLKDNVAGLNEVNTFATKLGIVSP